MNCKEFTRHTLLLYLQSNLEKDETDKTVIGYLPPAASSKGGGGKQMMNSWQLKRSDFGEGCGVQKGSPSVFWFVAESAHSQPTFERRVLKVHRMVQLRRPMS